MPLVQCALFVITLIILVIIIILKSHGTGLEKAKHGAGCTNTQLMRLKVDRIPYKVRSRVCLKLNIKRHLQFNDFRLLGEKVGLDKDQIDNIAQLKNPTDEILRMWSSHCEATVGRLIELLKDNDLGRMDVAEVLENWVNGEYNDRQL